MKAALLFIGGGGINGGVRFLKYKKDEENAIFIDSDACHTSGVGFQIEEKGEEYKKSHVVFLLGKHREVKMGVGNISEGEKLIEKDKEKLLRIIPEEETYVLNVSLGGGTGGASYRIVQMLRERNENARIIAITNTPSKLESKERQEYAKTSYKMLAKEVDFITNIDFNSIKENFNIGLAEIFPIIDELKARLIRAMLDNPEKLKEMNGEYGLRVRDKEGKRTYDVSGKHNEEELVKLIGRAQEFYLYKTHKAKV